MDWEYGSGFVNVGYSGSRLSVRTYGAYFSGRGTDEEFARDVTRFSQDALARLMAAWTPAFTEYLHGFVRPR